MARVSSRPSARRCRPLDGVAKDMADVLVEEVRIGLVAGLEVEDLAPADREGQPLPRLLGAAIGPQVQAVEHDRVGLGNLEGLV